MQKWLYRIASLTAALTLAAGCADPPRTGSYTFECRYDRIGIEDSTQPVAPEPLRMVFFVDMTTPNRGGGTVQRDDQEYQLKLVLSEDDTYFILETSTYDEMRTTTMHLVDDHDGTYDSVHS
jgi:hypothetical protein